MDKLIKNYHNLSNKKQNLLNLLLKEKGIDLNSLVILPQKREKELYELSFAQKRLWFLEKLEPNSPLYIIPMGLKIKGNLNIDYLIYALQIVVNRHEILRSRFIEKNGVGYQNILDNVKISANVIDLTSSTNSKEEMERVMDQEFTTPFNLSDCPLFRVTIIKVTPDYNILLLPMHHIISDNWSMGILLDEILKIYEHKLNGTELVLDSLKVQYLDYAYWQNAWLESDEYKNQLNFWKEELQDSNNILDIVHDKPKPNVQSYNGSRIYFNLSKELTSRIESFCREINITPFNLFLSVYQLILSRYAKENDINIGVPVANRNRLEVEALIGFFINTLVMRAKIDYSYTVLEYLSKNADKHKLAFDNQNIPFEKIVDQLELERDVSNTALFQAMLVLNNAQIRDLEFNGLKFSLIDYDTKTTKFNLVLSLTKKDDIYNCKFEYNTDLFYKSTIEDYGKQFVEILDLIIENRNLKINDLFHLQSRSFINSQSIICNPPKPSKEENYVHKAFSNQANNNPDKTAITNGIEKLTYKELDSYSNNLAQILVDIGISIETPIGVYLNRNLDYVIAILAIFKSGGTFVPLDVNIPEDRLNLIIKSSHVSIIITDIENESKFRDIVKTINIKESKKNNKRLSNNRKLNPSNSAYVIYTSGSTGLPKGVVVQHNNFYYHISQVIDSFDIDSNDKYLSFAAFNFDPSLEQTFAPLLAGATVFLRGDEYWMPSKFLEIISNERITVINPPTVYWNQFVHYLHENKITELGSLRLVIAGGEEMKNEVLKKWINTIGEKIKLINAYGPTETIITSSMHSITGNDIDNIHVPIGKIIGSRKGYIMDSDLNLLGPNMPGELYIGGKLLARNYINDPRLTAEKFIPNPFSKDGGERLYRTGDVVSYDLKGNIKYLGRIDNQVKIRGFRIELSEVESVISDKLNTQTITDIINDNSGGYRIIAYIIDNKNIKYDEKEIREYCAYKLPSYMIPSRIIKIAEVPLTINGKLDKSKLPKPELNIFERSTEFVEPRSELEIEISKIIANILNIEKVGVFDNFFELGGHSILAIKVVSEVKQNFGVDIELINLFQNPTVEGLAEAVVDAQSKLVDNDDLESLLDEIESV